MPYGAQHGAASLFPQVNQDFIVPSDLYQTIASAVTAASALSTGARVVILYGATPSDTIATQSGTANILIVDRRSGLDQTYNWTGSAYALQYPTSITTTGTVTAAGATFSAPVVLPSGTPTGQQAVSYSYLQTQLSNSGMLPSSTAVGQFLVSTSASGNTYTARGLQATDLPTTITSNTSGSAATLSQTLPLSLGGTGQTAIPAAFTALAASGGTLAGTLAGTPTFSGNVTFSGSPVFSGTPNFTGAVPFTINGSALVGVPATTASATPVFSGVGGNVFPYTLAQNVTSSTTTGLIPGQVYLFEIIQAASGTGPFTFVWPTNFLGNPGQVSQQASQKTILSAQATTGGQLIVLATEYI